jgi:glutamate-1-semialdehyde 2,1-aminomutase
VKADIVTHGKVIGGGCLSVLCSTQGNRTICTYWTCVSAGTFEGNPLAMSAGMAMLTHLHNHPEIFTSLAEVRIPCKGIAETLC